MANGCWLVYLVELQWSWSISVEVGWSSFIIKLLLDWIGLAYGQTELPYLMGEQLLAIQLPTLHAFCHRSVSLLFIIDLLHEWLLGYQYSTQKQTWSSRDLSLGLETQFSKSWSWCLVSDSRSWTLGLETSLWLLNKCSFSWKKSNVKETKS